MVIQDSCTLSSSVNKCIIICTPSIYGCINGSPCPPTLYAQQRHITSIISRFSYIILNLTRHLYNNLESVQRTSGKSISSTLLIINFTKAPISKPWVILYSFKAKTLLVTLLHLIKHQQMILALFLLFANTKTLPICDKRSLLLAKEALVKTSSYKDSLYSFAKRNSLVAFSICY